MESAELSSDNASSAALKGATLRDLSLAGADVAADAVAVIMFLGVVLYAIFGGADFGSGVWDLTAGGGQRGGPVRRLVDHAIGPVWEANHVWLIFCLVVLWTAFAEAFASITLTLFVPLTIAALGIVLAERGRLPLIYFIFSRAACDDAVDPPCRRQ